MKTSKRMRSAAIREMERVQRVIAQAERKADRTRSDLAAQEAALDQLGAQLRNLAALAGVEPAMIAVVAAPPTPIAEHALHGRHIRLAAMRVVKDGERIHYREWFDRFTAAGYVTATQKDPYAHFATEAGRCPLAVSAGGRSGEFVIDVAGQIAEFQRRATTATQHASTQSIRSVQRLREAENRLAEALLHASVIRP